MKIANKWILVNKKLTEVDMTSKIDHFIARTPPGIPDLPYHDNVRANQELGPIHRYMNSSLVPEADMGVSVREIKQVPPDFKPHLQPHKHDWSEVYAVIGDLTVEYTLGDETREVTGWSAFFIPAGTAHTYRPVRGSGYVVIVERSGEYTARD